MREFEVAVAGGVLHAYDTGGDGPVVVWAHGTPNTGAPPEPLTGAGVRFVSYDRPGYGGSTPRPGRDVASAAADTRAVADALGIGSFTVLSHSGGGPHALACGALLPGRVLGVATIATPAPYGVPGLDWFAGMTEPGALRAAVAGRAAKERYEADPVERPVPFTADDWATLAGPWRWFESVLAPGSPALVDDDLAYVSPWGFDPADVTVPVLLIHGAADEMVPAAHSAWLAGRCPRAELRLVPGAGHLSVLTTAPDAVSWLAGLRR